MLFFDLELNFPTEQYASIVHKYYYLLFIPACLYFLAIKAGQKFMSNKKPPNIGHSLVYWNLSLTIFSIFGTHRLFNEVVTATKSAPSLSQSVCVQGVLTDRAGFWFFLFALSKFVEFGDTFFLIIKKKPVIFLHWYHHITVMLLTFHMWSTFHPNGRYFTLINYFVHSLMYGYFTLTSLGFKISPKVALSITSLQLAQMFIGLFLSIFSLSTCGNKLSLTSGYFSLFIYTSYAFLFGQFLYKSYFSRSKTIKKIEPTQHESEITSKYEIDHNNNVRVKGA